MKEKVKISGMLVICIFLWNFAFSQLSPGDLAEVHAHLEGTANCTKCHVLGDKVSNEKCLDCHNEIKARIDLNKGYHSSDEVSGKDCFLCHNDHHGRNFQIIRFDADKFDHNLTGYYLEDSHASLECDKCHKRDLISDPELRKKEKTYLGLNTSCLSCHDDQHQGTLSKDCQQCHNFSKFSPAVKFDHMNTDYPLLGKHREVDCKLCHKTETREGKEFRVYKGINHSNCTSCHTDVHNDKFGQNCTQCHTEESFHTLKSTGSIDHNRTSFPLFGKHSTVDCKACHKGKYTDPVAHVNCMDCHKDYHEGQFLKAEGYVDCSNCHNVSGFTPSTFTFEKHQQTKFPLEGAHMATPCILCHKNELNPKWKFREIGMRCNDCHEDIHKTIINEKYYPEASCQNCHKISRWKEVTFDHKVTGYELLGKHETKTCRDCHFTIDENGVVGQKFNVLDASCKNCHKDTHHAQFEVYGPEGCLRCHGYEDWKASKFNHDNTNFKLEGKHKDLDCLKCHKEIRTKENVYLLYKIEDFRCVACH